MKLLRNLSALAGLTIGSLALLGTTSALADGIPQIPASADQNIFVFDITGSMSSASYGTGASAVAKFNVAKERVATYIAEIRKRTLPQRIELRTFTMSGAQSGTKVLARFDENKSIDQVLTMVNALTLSDVGGTTPLAGAVCDAIQSSEDLFETYLMKNPPESTNRYLYVISDGLENDTPTAATADCDYDCYRCQGTDIDDATLANLVANAKDDAALRAALPGGSWAYKMFNTAVTNNPIDPGTANSSYTVLNVDMLFDYISSASASAMTWADPYEEVAAADSGLYSANGNYGLGQVTADWESYFGRLAHKTGGHYRGIKANAAGSYYIVSTPLKMPIGDITGDGCVGIVDYNKMMQSDTWNQQVRPDKPHLYPADLDQDGWVRMGDYRILAANWAKGTCKPGDLR